ncbi:CASP-like protein [Hibiscus syriacus]|uniref:CASP-like protein n=1 Tax=Hibiscus syriacus TaxID=106335 RepID=A0A6A2WM13_HIBSY|nr:CASP-like protein [Hibiscus syriacus]
MDPATGKPSLFRNVLARALLFGVFILVFRFAYVITITGESCNRGDFCFFSMPQSLNFVIPGAGVSAIVGNDAVSRSDPRRELYTSKEWIRAVHFYSSVFQDLISDGYLSPHSKSLCAETPLGQEVFALKEIGVEDSIGIFKKAAKPLVIKVKMFDMNGFDSSMPFISEIVLRKETGFLNNGGKKIPRGGFGNKCSVPGHKRELVEKAEPLIEEEPLKPWITLKKNINNVKYLPSMVDISFKNRYVYVDFGARSYGSSIGSWFRKQYPKQNKTFHVYAIEADKHFHQQYDLKKKTITLLPYAAWVRNETLWFEINCHPGQEEVSELKDKGRGMGRIQPVKSNGGEVDEIQGFDFAE